MFHIKVVEKTKTHTSRSVTFSQKLCRLCDKVEKYDTASNDARENIIWRMRFASWITRATDTHP
jgi:hypothetical protein